MQGTAEPLKYINGARMREKANPIAENERKPPPYWFVPGMRNSGTCQIIQMIPIVRVS
jgi:hypothetical protein